MTLTLGMSEAQFFCLPCFFMIRIDTVGIDPIRECPRFSHNKIRIMHCNNTKSKAFGKTAAEVVLCAF